MNCTEACFKGILATLEANAKGTEPLFSWSVLAMSEGLGLWAHNGVEQ